MQRLCREEVTGGSIHRKKLRRAGPARGNTKGNRNCQQGKGKEVKPAALQRVGKKIVLIKETHR